MKKPVYVDVADLAEDSRIDLIGRTVTEQRKTVAFIVEDDEKADRYVKKLTERFKGVEILERLHGPVKDTVTVKVGPRVSQ